MTVRELEDAQDNTEAPACRRTWQGGSGSPHWPVALPAGLMAAQSSADPDDKSEVYQQLGLRLTYQPGKKVVRGAINLEAPGHWFFDGVRGGS